MLNIVGLNTDSDISLSITYTYHRQLRLSTHLNMTWIICVQCCPTWQFVWSFVPCSGM